MILRNDRIAKKGGGVAILISSNIHYIPVNHENQNILAVDIIEIQSSSTRYILIYRPPNFTKPQSTKLFDNVRDVLNIPSIFPIKNYILLGDFNYPDVKWDCDLSSQSGVSSPLIDLLLEKQFHQHQKSSKIPEFLKNRGGLAVTDKEKADALGQFYSAAHNPYSPPENDDSTTSTNENLNSIEFSEFEIEKMLKFCSNKNVKGVDNIPGYVLKKCSNSLCKPLKILFNFMIDSNDVPDLFLLSYVTPIPKIAKPINVENFRPISGTSDILKTMERCVKKVLVAFLDSKNFFPKQQYGFRAKMSTIQQLIPFQEFIIYSVSKKMTVDVIYFDWEKAFDKIPISRLIRALRKAGITGKLLNLIITLLSFRKFKVKVGNTYSEIFESTSGVPQGS
uniref:Reverse transcriptase domain-containing protein n=1 Tax=Panagrolaimus davidi TaxID=227884 RepID=A0A914QU69_9BILA